MDLFPFTKADTTAQQVETLGQHQTVRMERRFYTQVFPNPQPESSHDHIVMGTGVGTRRLKNQREMQERLLSLAGTDSFIAWPSFP